MKNKNALLVLFSALFVGSVQPSAAVGGKISFVGEITNTTCDVGVGGGVSGTTNNISVNLGKVSSSDVLAAGSTSSAGVASNLGGLTVTCANGSSDISSVVMVFDPAAGTGINPNDAKLLQIAPGGAEGVGIALFDQNNKVIDLSNSSSSANNIQSPVKWDASGKATVNMSFRAAYVKDGKTLKAGKANGTLPFILKYI